MKRLAFLILILSNSAAYAQVEKADGFDLAMSLLPFVILWVVWFLVLRIIGKRKGVSNISVAIGSFPVWSIFYSIWLASLTDWQVKQKLSIE